MRGIDISSLNEEQVLAVEAMETFIEDPGSDFFLLKGYAGTGKTYCIRALIPKFGARLVFTAPTNKATKVLKKTLTTDTFRPECRTIYSLLGLTMSTNGEAKELTAPDPDALELSDDLIVVVDEGSMVNSSLTKYIRQAQESHGCRFIFMGDPCQLPPVGEAESEIWTLPPEEYRYQLTKIMRYDNELLKLATAIREQVGVPFPRVQVASANDGKEGVWRVTPAEFMAALVTAVTVDRAFDTGDVARVIAWRNRTVDSYNMVIRRHLFPDTFQQPWVIGDRIVFTEPAKDFSDEIFATTDEEGVVKEVQEDDHPYYSQIRCHRLSIELLSGKRVSAWVPHPISANAVKEQGELYAIEARKDRRKWRQFWAFKEAFHGVRHAYALTAHRSQGSTYEKVFLDRVDILSNPTKVEAMKCFYVAATRASKSIITV